MSTWKSECSVSFSTCHAVREDEKVTSANLRYPENGPNIAGECLSPTSWSQNTNHQW